VDSASPEPSPPAGHVPTSGTAAQDPAADPQPPQLYDTSSVPPTHDTRPDEPASPAATAVGMPAQVTVVDEQEVVVDTSRLAALADHVLDALDVPSELELSVTCVDREAMTALNAEHMGADRPTDVLAFPIDAPADVMPGVPGLLGDVVLCPAVAHGQAADHGRTVQGEVDLLLVHGILHLLGHDHGESDERDRMFALTAELLASFALPAGTSA
jgi:probable rRNA maturation factor